MTLRDPNMKENLPVISSLNSDFWNEMCGSSQFRQLGLSKIDARSLEVFDDWYFEMYPYLKPWLSPMLSNMKSVVEIGLGFGTVSQYLAERVNCLLAVDIAPGPVELAKFRFDSKGMNGSAVVASVLNLPIPSHRQDLVVAIGSLHHVGDFEGSLNEIARVLKPGGQLAGMVYASYTLRALARDPFAILKSALKSGDQRGRFSDSHTLRAAADVNSAGDAAPFTEFFSRRSLRKLLSQSFTDIQISRRNADSLPFIGSRFRRFQLKQPLQAIFSLDLYFTATLKPNRD